MTEFRDWAAQWGDIASVAGFLLSVVGFAITIFGVWRAKSAAEQAQQAAVAARESIAHYDAITDLSSVMALMEEIKRHQRQGAWQILPDKYAEVKRRLVAVRESHAQLSQAQRQTLREAITTFSESERLVERWMEERTIPPSPATLNHRVSRHIDDVHAVLLSLVRTVRERHD
jgi:hypothetical protein